MAVMEHRTTFTLDETTIRRLKELAQRWRVSQAEVVRRAVAQAEADFYRARGALGERLRGYQAAGTLGAAAANRYLEEVAEQRADWGRGE
jgi:predicted transcriptional regulator